MAIEKKLICFRKLEDFETQLAAGNILDYSIVLIQDAKKIYNRGTYYDCEDLGERPFFNNSEFNFRATADAQNSIKDGMASIKELRGNSVVWNNMVDTRGYEAGFLIREGIKIQQGHKYLLQRSAANDGLYLIPIVDGSENYEMSLRAGEYAKIYTSQYTDLIEPRVYSVSYCGACVISDLTLVFGTGNEPTTIEEYEARKPVVEDEYAYNEGEVIHMTAEGIKSVGDNAIEERNTIITTNGFPGTPLVELNTNDAFIGITADGYVNANHINNVEVGNGKYAFDTDAGGYGIALFVNALPNELYHWSAETNGRIDIAFYDADRVLISHVSQTNEARTPYNCEYICLCLRDNEDITQRLTFSNIMLTLVHSGWKQDTDAGYQPYWEDRLIFDQRIKEHFPDGMKKWDMAYNRNGKGYVVKGTGVVDLGSLSWFDDTFNGVPTFTTKDVTNGVMRSIYGSLGGSIIALYSEMIEFGHLATSDDKVFVFNSLAHSPNTLSVRDTAYTDAASFKAALSEVLLYYELAKPTIIVYDEPFNLDYRVADFGTEQMLTEQPSAPIAAEIQYNFNANDTIRTNALAIQNLRRNKQDTLVSGTNIKTINGESIVGSGDIVIEGGETLTESDIAAMGFTKNTGTYSKPSGGIPKTDLASAVQASLGKADTALQSYTEQYKGTVTGVKINGTTKNPSNGVVDLGTVITEHQTLKTINGESIVGSGDITISGGSSSGGKEYVKKELTNTGNMSFSSFDGTLEPNKVYYSDTTIEEGLEIFDIVPPNTDVAEYTILFSFDNTSLASISTPSDWLWANGQIPEGEAGVSYELSVVATKVDGSFIYKAVLIPFKSV